MASLCMDNQIADCVRSPGNINKAIMENIGTIIMMGDLVMIEDIYLKLPKRMDKAIAALLREYYLKGRGGPTLPCLTGPTIITAPPPC